MTIYRNKTLCIVGESGCGKSITARSILQIVDPPGRVVEGEILYHRRDAAGQETTIDLARSIRAGGSSAIYAAKISR